MKYNRKLDLENLHAIKTGWCAFLISEDTKMPSDAIQTKARCFKCKTAIYHIDNPPTWFCRCIGIFCDKTKINPTAKQWNALVKEYLPQLIEAQARGSALGDSNN